MGSPVGDDIHRSIHEILPLGGGRNAREGRRPNSRIRDNHTTELATSHRAIHTTESHLWDPQGDDIRRSIHGIPKGMTSIVQFMRSSRWEEDATREKAKGQHRAYETTTQLTTEKAP